MADIQLDPLNEIDINFVNGDLVITEGGDAIRQHVLIRLKFFQGEYFLDQRIGVPYFQQILTKSASLVVARSLFQQTILETPGITGITEFDLDFNAANRTLHVEFVATADTGEELDFSEEFIIGDI